jgi:hypothetical protein
VRLENFGVEISAVDDETAADDDFVGDARVRVSTTALAPRRAPGPT